uniref:Phospholipase B-like n=1 Tax=Palpitomonas bilix TaxID=652834 RepID=A0A7S3GJS8_9EUKA
MKWLTIHILLPTVYALVCLSSGLAMQEGKDRFIDRVYVRVDAHKSQWKCDIRTAPARQRRGQFDAIATLESSPSGFQRLEVYAGVTPAKSHFEARVYAFAAGCAEAYLSQHDMFNYWFNYAANEYGKDGPSSALLAFMQAQWDFSEIERSRNTALDLLMTQFDGLVEGYSQSIREHKRENETLSPLTLYMLNSVGDLENLNGLFKGSEDTDRFGQYPPLPTQLRETDCSGLVRLTADGDILVGHATWRAYYAMLRVYKIYHYQYGDVLGTGVTNPVVSFSSSPGFLHSKDDFYASEKLIVFETTNNVFNQTLFELYIKNTTLLSWQRAMTATISAPDASTWTSVFSQHNSGTYDNSWVVVDLERGGKNVKDWVDGVIVLAEQIPGFVAVTDVTDVFARQQYWPSFNIPYSTFIYNMSGYPAYKEKYGERYDYNMCPRAQIFRRNATLIENVDDMKDMMRYNAYKTDPISEGDPTVAVAPRYDLDPEKPLAFGAVDAKVTSLRAILHSLRRGDDSVYPVHQKVGGQGGSYRHCRIPVSAVNGPTTYDGIPPFQWSDSPFSTIPVGVPDRFDYEYAEFCSRPLHPYH